MEIVVFEGFTDFGAVTGGDAPMTASWLVGSGSNFTLVNGIDGGRSLSVNDTPDIFAGNMTHMFAVPATKITIGFGFSIRGIDANSANEMFYGVDSTGARQWGLYYNSVGKLVLTGEGGAIIATSALNFLADVDYKCCLTLDHTGANAVNVTFSSQGEPDIGFALTGADLQDQSLVGTAGINIVTADINNPGKRWELHGLIIGVGEVVDWGPLEIIEGPPTIDIVSDWTPLSGTDNFAMVDETVADADTTYNYTETLNAKDIFGFTDPEIPESIVALGVVIWHKKEDSATRIVRPLLRIGGVDFPGDNIFCSETYLRSVKAFPLNPDTGLEWDPADLAALEYGYEYMGSTP